MNFIAHERMDNRECPVCGDVIAESLLPCGHGICYVCFARMCRLSGFSRQMRKCPSCFRRLPGLRWLLHRTVAAHVTVSDSELKSRYDETDAAA